MEQKKSKHSTKKRKKGNGKLKNILLIIIIFIIIIINLSNSPKKTSYKDTQIILNNENITENLQDKIIQEDGEIYMSFEDIKQFIDKTIYKEETGKIITTSTKKVAAIKKDEENMTINGSNQDVKNILIEQDGKDYIAISEMQNVYDYQFEYITESNVTVIENFDKKCVKAYAKNNIKIKEGQKAFSKVLETVKKGEWVVYICDENGMAKVRTQNGIIGYVKTKLLDNFITERDEFVQEKNNVTGEVLEYDITQKDISTFEKRQDIINTILQETIKSDKMNVKITYEGTENFEFERFKIEVQPILTECGITVSI